MKVSNKKTKKQIILSIATNCLLLLGVVAVSLVSFIPKNKMASAEKLNVVYEGNRNSKYVSLMINVYWGTEYVEPMLKVLEERNVKTTFFVGGVWVNEAPEMLKKIYDAGHEIANHGYNHKDHDKLSKEANIQEIQACHQAVKSVLGIEMTLFAPPSGAYNKYTISAAESLGQKTIMWTRDTIDWRDKNASVIARRALNNVKGGDLILMHPTAETLKALPEIVDGVIAKGLTVAPVSKTIA